MSFADFQRSTDADPAPPERLSRALQALWHDRRGHWETAHALAQEASGADGAWVHAYLHRKEGDPGNADYWYRLAGQVMPQEDLAEEWAQIACALLDRARPA
jgi:hypothetical protein